MAADKTKAVDALSSARSGADEARKKLAAETAALRALEAKVGAHSEHIVWGKQFPSLYLSAYRRELGMAPLETGRFPSLSDWISFAEAVCICSWRL